MGQRLKVHFSEAIRHKQSLFLPLPCSPIRMTDKAILVKLTRTGVETWLPKSVVEDANQVEPGDTELQVQEWFIEQNDLPGV